MDHSMPTPNYVNPVSIGCRVTDVGIVTVVFAFVFVVVRLLTKTLVTRQVWVDDCKMALLQPVIFPNLGSLAQTFPS